MTMRAETNSRLKPAVLLPVFLFLGTLLAACGGQVNQEAPFLPPTLAAPSPTVPIPTPAATFTPPATTAPTCTNLLTFQEDISYPDGSQVTPGASLDKRWRVQNAGTCNWDERYRFKQTSGSEMGAAPSQALYPARSGTETILQILFTAPKEPGKYRSSWQAFDPQDHPFGDPVYIEIIVTP